VLRNLSDEEIRWKEENAALYRQLAERSARTLHAVDALSEPRARPPADRRSGSIPLSEMKAKKRP
jgi:hypothetical protein